MFGEKLLQIMKEEDISVRGLSRMSGVGMGRIMDILAGIREPDTMTARRLADALGMDVRELQREHAEDMPAYDRRDGGMSILKRCLGFREEGDFHDRPFEADVSVYGYAV